MRTIKFRGKRLDGQGWVVGFYQPHANGKVLFIGDYSGLTDIPKLHKVIPESVGQWTGKFDINGVEIYQGDIVNSGHLKSDEWIPSIAVIEWDEDFAMFRQVLKGVNEGLEQLMDVPCEVIGNVIDSPELIEVK